MKESTASQAIAESGFAESFGECFARKFTQRFAERFNGGIGSAFVERFAQSFAQGFGEGLLSKARQILSRFGENRFGAPSKAIAAKLDKISSLEMFDTLIERTQSVASWEELLEPLALPNKPRGKKT